MPSSSRCRGTTPTPTNTWTATLTCRRGRDSTTPFSTLMRSPRTRRPILTRTFGSGALPRKIGRAWRRRSRRRSSGSYRSGASPATSASRPSAAPWPGLRSAGDGPLIESASLVALDGPDGSAVGAALVTLLPDADPSDWDGYHWQEPPPPNCVERRLGRPHLTWIFVDPSCAGHGVGTTLLAGAVTGLRRLGYHALASTFLPTNDSSVLWHWRCGFRLLEYAGSNRRTAAPRPRLLAQRFRETQVTCCRALVHRVILARRDGSLR